ncbi:MAG: NAD(P)-binding domain-containing protein, partial [Planctomycetota bacterium]
MDKASKTVAILGVGPAGSALGGAFVDSGFSVVSAYSRSAERAEKALLAMEAREGKGTDDPSAAASLAHLVVFAVPDKVVADLAGEVASAGGFREGGLAVHLSGSQPSSVLEPAKLLGARIGSLHPIKSFAGSSSDRDFTGVCIGIEGEEEAMPELEKITKQL